MKNKEYNIVKNLFFSSISTLTTFFLFILLTFLGRVLGSSEYGIFTTALSIATIFEMFTDFGLRDISIRNVSRDKNETEKYIGNLLVWKILLCLVIYVLMLVIVNALGYEGRIKTIIYILTVSSFLKNMKYTFRIFFQAHDQFGWDTILVIIERLSLLGFGLAALFRWKSLMPFTLCFVSVRFIDFLITLIVLRFKISPIKIHFNLKFMKNLQIEAFPLGLFFVILTLFSYIDTVMLSLMRTYAEVGLYNAAFKIYEGITIVPTIFWLVFLPRLSELYAVNRDHHRGLAIRGVRYMFFAGLPTLTYGIIFSSFLIRFFFHQEFEGAILTLQILFFGIAFQYPNWMLNATLISINKQRVMMVLGLVSLVIKIALNLILISSYGYNGSAVATVISELLLFAGLSIYLYWHRIKLPMLELTVRPLVASATIYMLFRVFPMVPDILMILITAALYLLLLLVMKGFYPDEIDTVIKNIQILGKRTGLIKQPAEK
ncbi:flippase [candidate division KSB1 bacterium]|nr:flippase [candidate division KSB1 bacterium]